MNKRDNTPSFQVVTAFIIFFFSTFVYAANSCSTCHGGIEHIRSESSGMMKAILEVAEKAGHAGNDCIVCHGGNPEKKEKKNAHSATVEYFKNNKGPKEFYPAPASAWINQNTCGMCHENQVASQMNSLMMTEQGKIQGTLWSFGAKNSNAHDIGTYKTQNPQDPHARLGTEQYRNYMDKLSLMEPQAFPKKMKELPKAPTADEVQKDPSLAVYTYLRQECLRCHTGSKDRQVRGDYRGIGCASCHIPYSNEGFYKGEDKSIDKKKPGHLLVHSIQSSRDAKVKVHEKEYSGVPVETCSTCHNRGKRIGVSYQGLMETEYQSTYDGEGNPQPKLHTKRYMHMQEDIHFQKGMLCQDCHTSNDMHGDGFLGGANLAAVEIECQDCHGTTKAYPWELPLGYSDEFNTTAATGEARGTTKTVAEYLKQGSVSEPEDGYLISARGNPLPHAVKIGDTILMHLASGKDITLKPLKKLKQDNKLSKKALLAMDSISAHTDTMECYTCHATWAPQCYGCHVKIDYSKGKQNPDYLMASHDQDIHGQTGGMKDLKKYLVDGQVTESNGFMSWEDPPLSQNGEGRISTAIAGCQTTITVIGKEGKALLQNHMYKIPHAEGQNAIDMSPIQPHTISKGSRSCESCHTNPKAMGVGMSGLKISDANATQLQTLVQHFKLSRELSKEQRDKLDRSGVCISCHLDIPSGSLAIAAMSHMAQMAEVSIDNDMHKTIVNKTLNVTAWVQVLGGALLGMLIMLGIYISFFKKQKRNPRNEGWK